MIGKYARASIFAAVLAMAAPTRAQESQAPDLAPYHAAQFIDGVRLMAPPPDYLGFATSNILIVEQQDGIVVVDSGFARADGDRVVAYVRSFTDKPVKALIITHWHNDHPQGASQIREAWPDVRIIATEQTRFGIDGPARSLGLAYQPSPEWEAAVTAQINEGVAADEAQAANAEHDALQRQRFARRARQFRERIPDIAGTHLVAPTEILRDEILIDDPERPVRVLFLGRANTDGDAIVWLPNQRLVATGDVVVSPIPFGFFSYPADWIEALGRIKALEFELLVPGHGLPQSDSAYVDRLVATITDIRTQVGALAAQRLTLEQVRERVDFSAQTAIFGPTNRRRVAFEGLWLRPMIENAWKEARGIPIVQGEGEAP
ncbi:MAG: MBL fold metallo-hydrolase [Sphingomonadaceae bacterium]|nr:MBL fold metallo-hydrolase [Sphingomonadaceae bacterium]